MFFSGAAFWNLRKKNCIERSHIVFHIKALYYTYTYHITEIDFPSGSESKESTCNPGDHGLIPGLGSFPGEGNGKSLQYSCLENSMTEESGRLCFME